MNARFENPPRCSATGLTTSAMLTVVLVMAASTLFTPDGPAASAASATSSTHVVQSHQPSRIKKDS
jgi:hypothetical protein